MTQDVGTILGCRGAIWAGDGVGVDRSDETGHGVSTWDALATVLLRKCAAVSGITSGLGITHRNALSSLGIWL